MGEWWRGASKELNVSNTRSRGLAYPFSTAVFFLPGPGGPIQSDLEYIAYRNVLHRTDTILHSMIESQPSECTC